MSLPCEAPNPRRPNRGFCTLNLKTTDRNLHALNRGEYDYSDYKNLYFMSLFLWSLRISILLLRFPLLGEAALS